MTESLLTDEQKEQMFLTNPDILTMVKRAIKRTKQETAKQIFEKQERHVLKELAWVVVKIQKEKDNPIWKQDKGNLEEWLRFIKEQRAKFLQGENVTMTFIDNCKDCGCSKELCCKQETAKQIFEEIESMLNVSPKTEFVLTSKRFKQIKAKFLQGKKK